MIVAMAMALADAHALLFYGYGLAWLERLGQATLLLLLGGITGAAVLGSTGCASGASFS